MKRKDAAANRAWFFRWSLPRKRQGALAQAVERDGGFHAQHDVVTVEALTRALRASAPIREGSNVVATVPFARHVERVAAAGAAWVRAAR